MVLLLILLTMCDAALTLYIIAHGGIEANPIMHYFLDISVWHFLLAKFILTASGIYVLAKTQHYTISKVALIVLPLLYGALVVYEIALIVQ